MQHAGRFSDSLPYLSKLGAARTTGKLPNIYISASVAKVIDEKAQYIKNKGFDDEYYKDMIVDFIRKFGKANKNDIRNLLLDKLSNVLNQEQKENKIRNILTTLKTSGTIVRDSNNNQKSNWILSE